jgi:hypothetical protein
MTTTCTSCGASIEAAVAPHAGRFEILCERCRSGASDTTAFADTAASDADLALRKHGR